MHMGQAQAQEQQNQFFAQRGFNPNAAGGAAGGAAGQFGGTGAAGAAGRTGAAGAAGRNATFGTIKKIDGNTITLTVPNSDDITVSLPADATIIKTVTGTVSDLKEGQRLTVMGARSGNNIAATAVQVTDLPAGTNFAGFGGGRNGGARATPTPGQ
jgi:Cu/Ag efflux protein CusF